MTSHVSSLMDGATACGQCQMLHLRLSASMLTGHIMEREGQQINVHFYGSITHIRRELRQKMLHFYRMQQYNSRAQTHHEEQNLVFSSRFFMSSLFADVVLLA